MISKWWSLLLCGFTSASIGASVQSLTPVHYDLDLAVDFDREVLQAKAGMRVKNTGATEAKEASLLLNRLLRVQSIHDSKGVRLTFTQAVSAFTDFSKLQVNHIRVQLPRALQSGGQIGLIVKYDGHLTGYTETGMLYIQDRIDREFTIIRDDAYAYPKLGGLSFEQNRAAPEAAYTYTARIAVPADLFVANGGKQEPVERRDQSAVFQYSSLKPSWRMDFAIAKYAEHQAGPIRILYFPADAKGAQRVANAAEQSAALFTQWFGPRAAASALTFIEIPDGWGSQTDVTTIIQSASAFKDPARMHEVYHEVSHLWDISSTERPSSRWNEGLATFLEYLVADELDGSRTLEARTDRIIEWLSASLPTRPAWKETPLIDYGAHGLTDLSYSVGAVYFHLLYRLLGREAFNQTITNYINRYRDSGGSLRDLLAQAQATTTMDLHPLNDDWILTTGWANRVLKMTAVQRLEAHYRSSAE